MKTPWAILGATAAVCLAVAVSTIPTNREREETSVSSIPNPLPPGALSAASKTRVFFGHQSVGGNVISAIPTVYAASRVRPPQVVETAIPPADPGAGFLAHAAIGVNSDPASKLRSFEAAVRGPMGDAVDVALMKFCYVDIVAATDVEAVFDRYAELMLELERDYPDVRFLYATVPVTAERGWKRFKDTILGDAELGPAHNAARERYNRMVRERYAATGRLWDIATIESTPASGTRVGGELEGQPYLALYSGFASDPGHLNSVGSQRAATELLSLIAAHGSEPATDGS